MKAKIALATCILFCSPLQLSCSETSHSNSLDAQFVHGWTPEPEEAFPAGAPEPRHHRELLDRISKAVGDAYRGGGLNFSVRPRFMLYLACVLAALWFAGHWRVLSKLRAWSKWASLGCLAVGIVLMLVGLGRPWWSLALNLWVWAVAPLILNKVPQPALRWALLPLGWALLIVSS